MVQQQRIDNSVWTAVIAPKGKTNIAWFSAYAGGRRVHMSGQIYDEHELRAGGYTFTPLVAMTEARVRSLELIARYLETSAPFIRTDDPERAGEFTAAIAELRGLLDELKGGRDATDQR